MLFCLCLYLRASDISVCYVSEDYKRLDTIFGHLFLAYNNKAASFNLNSNLNLKDNLLALFGVDGVMQILPKDKLIKFYEDENRSVTCYMLNLNDTQDANLSALFYSDEKNDKYTFLYKNCSSALSMYAKDYNVELKSSLVPLKFVSLNTNNKFNFYKLALFYEYDLKHNLDFNITLLSLNDNFKHKLNLFSFDKSKFNLINIAEYDKISYEFEFGISYNKAKIKSSFFVGYFYKYFFIGFNNYGANAGIIYEKNNYGIKLSLDKKLFQSNLYIDYKNYRFNLIANKNYAKIGLIYRF